ncbi:homogentisate 1,2-dioxygenase [Chitinivorax tropicus]|uniref:Homogentisate 1,2-dioxygenase n=1 Tax=Chitinivorax tropicus TaxID=714531 RepID=A0A840MK24_9PROT|nr:homogentisate 1,2-dioxygenase [Chitinivorax tropicus]MBB5016916.1 homogentisate 1,2-dioxygenase [Chitinivorax tropicus]
MKKWISFPKSAGEYSKQAHCDLPTGTYEREMGKEGFFGPACHFHHQHPPTAWISFDGPLQPHAFDLNELALAGPSPWDAHLLFSNHDTRIRYWQLKDAMTHLVRNADGDELLFIHEGAGDLYCDWGHLPYRDGDYIMLPRGSMWRLTPSSPTQLMLIEATQSSYQLPEKGMVGPHAIFDPAVLETPALNDAFRAQQGNQTWQVKVKRARQLSTLTYPFNPLDTTGWHGDLVACKVNWRDIRPLMSHRYHLPPSAHTTFVARNFVICTFAPRPIESDPGALKVPFYHNNDDYDELIFYHRGNFFSRDNIKPGMMTLHPNGFTHGPHPKAFEVGMKASRTETDEVAVMIDTRFPLDIHEPAQSVEWPGYVDSWKPKT